MNIRRYTARIEYTLSKPGKPRPVPVKRWLTGWNTSGSRSAAGNRANSTLDRR
jgi:hypothetical protein